MSRYIERAENTARILDVNMQLLLDFEDQKASAVQTAWEPLLVTLEAQELFSKLHGKVDAQSVQEFLTFERQNPNSIFSCICKARENARTVREQISSEMWEHLNKLYLYLREPSAMADFLRSPSDFYRRIVHGSHLFQGVTDATMTHGEGWHFLCAGKFLERADNTSRLVDMKYHILLPRGEMVGGNVDITQWMAVLRSCSAMEAFLKIHSCEVNAANVASFLILHDCFPRSIRFCVDSLHQSLHHISGSQESHFVNEVERLSGMLRSSLDYTTISEIFRAGLHEYLDRIQLQLGEISVALTRTYCVWLEDN